MNVIRVFLADDHLMLTEALAERLSRSSDVWVVGRAAVTDTALPTTIADARPDVVTVEPEQLGSRASEWLHALRNTLLDARIVMLSASRDPELVVAAARAGADAWVPKERSAEELLEVLRAVRLGHAWYPPEFLGTVLRELRRDVASGRERGTRIDALSGKEREVLLAMVEGVHGSRIAERLGISRNTMRTHMRNMFRKLDVHSGLEAVKVARLAGMRPRDEPRHAAVPPVPIQRS